ncbi:MAG TPA: hypothetical protein VMN79_04805 [Casimicrobiaceae bacterium]|nr:hypothetical protein [Casimicrobiaceae bacterium]
MIVAVEYLWIWFWWTVVLLGSVSTVNVLVDPYGLFRVVDLPGINRLKSQASERGTLFKQSAVARLQPRALVLGNSRAEIGFDPESPVWPPSARPAFNLALPGAGIGAVADEFARALGVTDPKLVVVGLDFVDFRVDPSASDRFVLRASGADPWRDWRDRSSALLTMTAFADSLATVRAQHEAYPTALTDAGFNPKQDYVGIARREGYSALFRQRDRENAFNYRRGPKSVLQASDRSSPAFDAVDSIVRLARERGIALRFVIYPYHAHTLVLFDLTGLWPAYESWKRELAQRIDAARGGMDVELWDFTGFSPYADEAVPTPGDTHTELKWYWEAGHFKKGLGDVLLATLFDGERGNAAWGCRVTTGDIEAQLAAQKAARDRYEASHPADMADLKAAVAAGSRL